MSEPGHANGPTPANAPDHASSPVRLVLSEQVDRITLLRIDRHEQRNALNHEVLIQLQAGLDAALEAGSRSVVITGQGSSFCSGADLDLVRDEAFRARMYRFLHGLDAFPMPVIAAVNGPAIGAGTQLAIACDLRVAAPTARFAVPTARLGIAVDTWSVRRLAALAGGGGARAMLLGVDSLAAGRAHQLGLADRLGGLDDALAWAREIATLAPLSLRYSKLALTSLDSTAELDEAFAACWNSADARESALARAERRPPSFRGA